MPSIASERRQTYLERKERGYCPRCGNKKGKSKTTYCNDCKKYFAEYNRDNAEIINETRRARGIERRQTRKCTRCGKYLAKTYKNVLCAGCLDKAYEYSTGKKRSQKNNAAKSKKQAVRKLKKKKKGGA